LEATQAETLLGMNDKSIVRKIQNAFELERIGNDLVLTLDSRLQEVAYREMEGKSGAVVALDPRTGKS
jgi:peptidoglycan glycosyltransferase